MSHTYATDAQTKSGDLAVTISAASSPQQISAACASVESFLLKQSPDQSRWFFSVTFPTLICKLFGFEPQNPNPNPNPNPSPSPNNGWIHNADLSGKLYAFLSPSGVLMNSVRGVDRLSLVKYVFPIERLPEWVRLTLQNTAHCAGVLSEFCPLFGGGRLKDGSRFELNILEYYLFWFAYYPVSKGSSQRCVAVTTGVSKKFSLEKWTIPVFGSGSKCNTVDGDKGMDGGSLYVRLLQAYLRFFVPFSDLSAQSPYRSSLLHYSSGYDSLVFENAEFFVHTLIHFWIVDNDFSPLPVKVCKSFGVVLTLRSVLAELPPKPGLGEVVEVLVKYLNSSLVPKGVDQVEVTTLSGAGFAADVDMSSSMRGSIGYWNSCIQRPLYRYILRTFLFCPVETSVKSVSHVFSLWVNYIEPWAISLDKLPEKYSLNVSKPLDYSSSWQGFVISNYLFYTSLVMHFIGFAHKFIHTDAEVIVQMITKVVNILTSSRELVDLIKNVDIVFHSVSSGSSKSMLNTLYRFVPLVREQLQDWEDGLSETDADGSFLHENWNKDLKLFSTSDDGGQQLLQLLAIRAESELQLSGENFANNLQLVSLLKSRMGYLFGGSIIRSSGIPEGKKAGNLQHEIFRPRTAGNRPTTDIRYKGDWMKRPISNDEVAWLANLLVKLSGWLNEILGLCPLEHGHGAPAAWSYVEVSGDTVANVCGPKDSMRIVLGVICFWLITLGRETMKFMREHGMRVNLRMLASKKVVTLVLLVIAFSAVKRMVTNFSIM